MARRRSLDDAQWESRLSPPRDEREIIRRYTLNDEDLPPPPVSVAITIASALR